jgi:predicted transcriptional regulator
MTQVYKVIKLRSGEELIAEIASSENDKVTLLKPMVFKSIVLPDPMGMPKEGIVLKNWLAFGNQTETTIPSDFIATILEPTQDVVSYYLSEKDRQGGFEKTPLDEFTNQIKPKITPEQDMNAADYEDMISDMFDTIFNGMTEPKKNDSKSGKNKKRKDKKEEVIHMSMVFSPQALAFMINEGMIDPRDIMDMIKHFNLDKPKKKKKNNRESINDQKYTGEQKDRDDFGNKWTDWNPDPSSDEYM